MCEDVRIVVGTVVVAVLTFQGGGPMIVGVIGSGAIGPDLAYGFVSALAKGEGGRVYLLDIRTEALDAGMKRIGGYVQKGLSRGKLNPKVAQAAQEALCATTEIKDLADCDYVLEAATEDLPLKQAILADLEGVVRKDCLIGFATSGTPSSRLGDRLRSRSCSRTTRSSAPA
jgi:enoyl-CoA hydratase/3-hydroxyacyl-CoA dehydrogenase